MNQAAEKLTQDHREIDSLLRCLADDAEAPCAGVLEATWNVFEPRLLQHMHAEEQFLLPLIEASAPAEVARTRREHVQICDLVASLGVAIDLHAVRASDVYKLIDLLRAHSKHEDEVLYQIAGDKASVAVEHGIFASIKSALHPGAPSAATGHDAASQPRARSW